jgi:hypothetical protein
MYESLKKNCDDFHLYVFAFDDRCFNYLSSEKFPNLTVISLEAFETEELLTVKKQRTAAEYCWTCSSSTIHHCITNFGLDNCTYVDADMLFYSNPRVLIDEMRDKSVLITAHRYTPEYDQSSVSGKFCVQFMTFKNTVEGMLVLNWWRNACIEWCYARVEEGKFGDQKYVDEFQTRFSGVHELEHLGGGVAPWNLQQYSFVKKENKIIGTEIATQKTFEVVFFHFHSLKFYDKNIVCFSDSRYALSKQVQALFYKPYVALLNSFKHKINKQDKSFDPNGNAGVSPYKPLNLKLLLWFYLSGVRASIKNVFGAYLKKRIAHHYYFYNR